MIRVLKHLDATDYTKSGIDFEEKTSTRPCGSYRFAEHRPTGRGWELWDIDKRVKILSDSELSQKSQQPAISTPQVRCDFERREEIREQFRELVDAVS